MQNKEEHEKKWRENVESYRSSGKSQLEWCLENNLPHGTLKYWIGKINKEQSAKDMPEWIDLDVGTDKIAKLPLVKLGVNAVKVSIGKATITFPVTSEVEINIC